MEAPPKKKSLKILPRMAIFLNKKTTRIMGLIMYYNLVTKSNLWTESVSPYNLLILCKNNKGAKSCINQY